MQFHNRFHFYWHLTFRVSSSSLFSHLAGIWKSNRARKVAMSECFSVLLLWWQKWNLFRNKKKIINTPAKKNGNATWRTWEIGRNWKKRGSNESLLFTFRHRADSVSEKWCKERIAHNHLNLFSNTSSDHQAYSSCFRWFHNRLSVDIS